MKKKRKKSSSGKAKLGMINNILMNEIAAGKKYISMREKDLEDTQNKLVQESQEFMDMKERALREQSEKMNQARQQEMLEREAMIINMKIKEDELKLANEANKRHQQEIEEMLRAMKEEEKVKRAREAERE